jgi:hypothetical protein
MKYWIALLFLVSCAPASWDDLRAEGEAETRKLALLLHRIDTKEQLQKELPKIKKSYLKIADLILEVKKMGSEGALPEIRDPSDVSDALFAELARLYEMPGCRELIEGAQSEAIHRLIN